MDSLKAFDTNRADSLLKSICLFKQLLRHGYLSSCLFLQLAVLEREEVASVGNEAFACYLVEQWLLPLVVSITNIYRNQDPIFYC